MKIVLLVIGKTNQQYIIDGINDYSKRLKYYANFEMIELPAIKSKNKNKEQIKIDEGARIQKYFKKDDYIILLDEKGDDFTSLNFSVKMRKWLLHNTKNIVFVIGGAYGHSDLLYKYSHYKLSLSKMTFSHQLIRLFFLEQLYRSFTIINNHPYHNQ
tara:strand:+ start:4630 stop:5100 length:471 start_codon:yes stop_codon:yes gene_type:complete